MDTAGLRETADAIEAEGTRRARAAIDRADVLLYVVDATVGRDAEEQAFLADLARRQPEVAVLVVANKTDLLSAHLGTEAEGLALSAQQALSDDTRLDALRGALLAAVRAGGLDAAEGGLVAVNERHRAHLEAAREAIGRARTSLDAGDGGDTLALDLRDALHQLGLVTGAVTTEHVLDAVFSQFCIGK